MNVGKISGLNTISRFKGNEKTNTGKTTAPKTVQHDKENPISKPLEQLDVFKATLIAGLGFGARALYYVFEDTDLLEYTYDAGKKLAQKNYKDASKNKLFALGLASWGAIIIGLVGILAAVYAIYNAPKSMYQGKINAHKKAEEMDVYLESNRIEQELYKEVGKKAKEASTEEELEKTRQQALKLKTAKNEVPSFVQK